ncbi:MAG: type II CAAX endopeptidase family protein, partial [Bacteroidota bacterium]
RAIAERAPLNEWGVDLSQYRLVEKSQEVRPSGRIDHTIVYERPNVQIGEGKYRLRLVVGGDKLTELTHFVKVPEAFSRRYEEMRSANNVIGVSGSIGFIVLYIIGGCGVGLFFLLRQRWVLWRKPLFWGLLIAFLQLLVGINRWPLIWMNYDTAISAQGFLLQQIAFILINFLVMGLLLTVSFMAAESLSRRAFPHHIQQWSLWSRDVASSKAVLGRTVAGYLLVGIFFAYEVALYFVTTRALGWWTPSDVLVQPDVLATYFPWLSSIAISAQAGFWEESLFRAVPIAGAALLGDRFGGRRWWIIGAMIIQALVFGSGHAGYANQPAYARVVELIIPSLMFGGIYIYFGLLPAIVLHFTFDVVWFALPLFVSSAPGIWLDRSLVLILVLAPLWIVLGARLRAKRWIEVSEGYMNRSWSPPQPVEVKAVEEKPQLGGVHPALIRFLPIVGLVGLALWAIFTSFRTDAPSITIGRTEAEQIARQTVKDWKVDLPESWRVLSSVEAQPAQEDRFIWQTAGKEVYKKLMGEHLAPPHWRVRFVQFEGDVAERAEEYQVYIGEQGRVFRFRHQLPEARPGNSISENDARILAHLSLKGIFQLEAASLREVSAVPSKLKARTDWLFTFADTIRYKLQQGEARMAVQIAGDKVVDAYRFVHVPEEWARNERDQQNIPQIAQIGCSVIVVLLVIGGVVGAIVNWSRKKFSVPIFLLLFLSMFVFSLADLFNGFPGIVASFSTAQPYTTQIFIFVGGSIVALLIMSASVGLVAGFVRKWNEQEMRLPPSIAWVLGISLGAIFSGILALGSSLGTPLSPTWADYGGLGTYLPLLDAGLGSVSRYLLISTLALFIFTATDRFTHGWTKRKVLFAFLLIVSGLIFVGSRSVETIVSWLVLGLVIGLLFFAAYNN